MKTQVTLSRNKFRPELYQEIKNELNYKPLGGLWSCDTNEGDYISAWAEFVCCNTSNNFREYKYYIIFEIKKNARVYLIDSKDEAKKFIKEAGYKSMLKKSPAIYNDSIKEVTNIITSTAKEAGVAISNEQNEKIVTESKKFLDNIHNSYNLIDWENASKKYDVVHLTLNGLRECSDLLSDHLFHYFLGWDVESSLIMNKDVIDIKEHIKI